MGLEILPPDINLSEKNLRLSKGENCFQIDRGVICDILKFVTII